jgi:flagellin-specific chaperone FliS
MTEEKKIVSDKNMLFARAATESHHIRVSPDADEYLQVWIKQPTWLQVEQALSSVMDMDSQGQTMGINLNKMYRYMVDNFVEKTEPQLSATELIRLNPYVGAQLKEILPNPFMDVMGDDTGNEN